MEKILLAGPDPVLLTLLRHALKDIRAEVHTALSEDHFISRCDREHYRLVITQFIHPFLNGEDLASRIKNVPEGTPRPAIFVLSWLQHEPTLLSLYENGVDQYLTLPVNIPRLASKVTAQLTSRFS